MHLPEFGYVNVYEGGYTSRIHSSQREADQAADDDRVECVMVKIVPL